MLEHQEGLLTINFEVTMINNYILIKFVSNNYHLLTKRQIINLLTNAKG